MTSFFRHTLYALLHLGYLGPLLMGVADSSFLFLPIGNDLLIVVLVARHHAQFWAYCLAGALGSATGVLLVDVVARKLGETGVQKMTGQRRFEYLKKKIDTRGGFFIALAALSPPPFPFTMVVATTSALAYPTKKLFAIVFASRLVRFFVFSYFAIKYGEGILKVIDTDWFKYTMIGFAVICGIVSALSIAKWVKTGKRGGKGGEPVEEAA